MYPPLKGILSEIKETLQEVSLSLCESHGFKSVIAKNFCWGRIAGGNLPSLSVLDHPGPLNYPVEAKTRMPGL